MGNAFWNGQAMFYGNGDNAFQPLAKGLDVAGHEMTHGVVEGTANLEYQGKSGALNQSFADIFGVMIDRDDWKIGEDVVKTSAFPSGALRSMGDHIMVLPQMISIVVGNQDTLMKDIKAMKTMVESISIVEFPTSHFLSLQQQLEKTKLKKYTIGRFRTILLSHPSL